MAAEQRRGRVIIRGVFRHAVGIGIAIKAAIGAGVVKSQVDAGNTAAFLALVFVFGCIQGKAGQPFNERAVDAAGMPDTVRGKVDALRTGGKG